MAKERISASVDQAVAEKIRQEAKKAERSFSQMINLTLAKAAASDEQ